MRVDPGPGARRTAVSSSSRPSSEAAWLDHELHVSLVLAWATPAERVTSPATGNPSPARRRHRAEAWSGPLRRIVSSRIAGPREGDASASTESRPPFAPTLAPSETARTSGIRRAPDSSTTTNAPRVPHDAAKLQLRRVIASPPAPTDAWFASRPRTAHAIHGPPAPRTAAPRTTRLVAPRGASNSATADRGEGGARTGRARPKASASRTGPRRATTAPRAASIES